MAFGRSANSYKSFRTILIIDYMEQYTVIEERSDVLLKVILFISGKYGSGSFEEEFPWVFSRK